MTRYIRWGGLVAFLVVVGLVAGFWFLFVDGIVEEVIEDQGTRAVGAKVELASADLSLLPAGLTLVGLQVTNPDAPMTNAVEIGRLALTLDALQLVRRKVIVDEMTVDAVRFGTPRETSGAIAGRAQPTTESAQDEEAGEGAAGSFTMPTFEVPDVKEILENEELETLKLAKSFHDDIQKQKDLWEQRVKDLPGKDTFAKYQARIEKLQGSTKGGLGGILGGVGEIQSIQKEVERDIERIETAQKELESLIASFEHRIKEVAEAPRRDVRRLQEKYSLSPHGLANLGSTLFGQHIGKWARQAADWYEKLKPALQRMQEAGAAEEGPEVVEPVRGSGVDVRFKEYEPLPDFLIRHTNVFVELEAGKLAGTIDNITPDQDVLGKPLTLEFSGQEMKGLSSVTLQGTFDHIDPGNSTDRVTFQLAGYELPSVPLSDQPQWPVRLNRGLADVGVRAILKGNAVDANINVNLKSLAVSAGKQGDTNPLTRALSSAVSGVSALKVEADVTGTLEEQEITVRSDLDQIMKRAAGRLVADLSREFQKELSGAIAQQVKGPLRGLQGQVGGLEAISGNLSGRLTQGNSLLGGVIKPGGASGGLPGGLKLPF